MQVIPEKSPSQKAPKVAHVRISTDELTDREMESIRNFLEADPLIESVVAGPLSMIVEAPKKTGKNTDLDGKQALTIEISAAAEPAALIINFLKDNKDALQTAGTLMAAGAPIAVGSARYVARKLKEYCKKRKGKFTKIPLYDGEGNVIKWTKRKIAKEQ